MSNVVDKETGGQLLGTLRLHTIQWNNVKVLTLLSLPLLPSYFLLSPFANVMKVMCVGGISGVG